MEIKEYIDIVKLLQKEGISENIICRVLEEYGKDIRTNTMEQGKNKRTGYIDNENEQKPRQEPQKQESKAVNQETLEKKPYKMKETQWDILVKISNTEKGKEYLESKGYYAPEDLYELSSKEAYTLIGNAPSKRK